MEEKAMTRGWNKNPLNHLTLKMADTKGPRARVEHHSVHICQGVRQTKTVLHLTT